MTSNARIKKIALDIVRSDGAERAIWSGGRSGRNQYTLLRNGATQYITMYLLTTLCQCLELQEQVDTLLSGTWFSKMLNNSLFLIHMVVSFPENSVYCLNPC